MTCCYFSIRGFGGIWKETRAAELFKNSKRRARLRGNQNSDQPFFGRPVFSCGSAASTFCSVARSIWLISATPMRSNSLFLISKPAFRQAFLTWPSTAYSCSGMVKLSRTSLSLSLFLVSAVFSAGLAAVFAAAALLAGFASAGLAAGFGGWLSGFRRGLGGRFRGGFGHRFCSGGLGGCRLACSFFGDRFGSSRFSFACRCFRRGSWLGDRFFRRRLDVGNRHHGGGTVGASWCRCGFDWG